MALMLWMTRVRGSMGMKLGAEAEGPDIPFTSEGTTIYFDTRTPTAEQLGTCGIFQADASVRSKGKI